MTRWSEANLAEWRLREVSRIGSNIEPITLNAAGANSLRPASPPSPVVQYRPAAPISATCPHCGRPYDPIDGDAA